jgi:predicted RNase H-like nuclease (RuvC/YqgF family)
MNPAFLKTLRAKKKRERDPNLPPPPNLFSQAKELRQTRQSMDLVEIEISMLKQRLERVESRNRELEMRMETLQNWVQKRTK